MSSGVQIYPRLCIRTGRIKKDPEVDAEAL